MSFKIHKIPETNNVSSALSSAIGLVNPYVTALGAYSGSAKLDNTFIGAKAGESAVGTGNTFLGNESGRYVSGTQNVIIGDGAGSATTSSGSYNTFIGAEAGLNNELGTGNIFLGAVSGVENTDGNSNVFIGQSAGAVNIDGDYNVFIGNNSGNTVTGGSSNICIGEGADTDSAIASNRIVIGHGVVGTQDNSVTFPNNLTGSALNTEVSFSSSGGGRLYPVVSSRRFKTDISDYTIDPNLVYELQPRKFTYTATNEKSIGFIAEEVDRVFPELVPKDDDGRPSSVRYSLMCLVLLEAIKQMHSDLDKLKNILT